ncbi:hypothetical protein [Tepidimonas charontis]|uniref:Uncharacterized protein n=1 Tax=Tepidimonas charontis TaxID=2267262 RepID=A0A554XCA2_9BURK|nr:MULTISPECIES: hypothetical protein [Pseudomonadota]MBW7657723.1 hypothetical protein [Hydrogenophilus thermoluteolus]TSE33477.1 hypothetical protein Tchar_01733 [Tepidimonas charontis]
MIPTYTASTQYLRAADFGSQYLDESGAFVVTIEAARAVQSSKGGWGVELHFTADDGRRPRFAPCLWTLSPTGERYFGHDLLDAILFCAGFPEGHALKPGKVRYWRFDREIGEEVEAIGDGYPDLAGRKVGLVLQREIYTTKTGKEGSRLAIVGAFDPATRQTASEKKEGLEPKILSSRLARLKDKDSRSADTLALATDNSAPVAPAGAFDDLEDSIPF